MSDKKHYWFKRRRYGYGWIPTTWQGWVVILTYIAIIFLLTLILGWDNTEPDTQELVLYFTAFTVTTVLLIVLSYAKGPRPKWRWGKSSSDNPDEDI